MFEALLLKMLIPTTSALFSAVLYFGIKTLTKIDKNQSNLFTRVGILEDKFIKIKTEHNLFHRSKTDESDV